MSKAEDRKREELRLTKQWEGAEVTGKDVHRYTAELLRRFSFLDPATDNGYGEHLKQEFPNFQVLPDSNQG